MAITFKYKTIKRPDGTEVKTPSIPILFDAKEKFKTLALLDSGADISAVSQSVAEIIGLDLSEERKFADGIGGKVESVETFVNGAVEKGHESYTFRIPIKVVLGDYDFPVLLGRVGLFNRFIISFNQAKEKVSLERINE